MKLLLLMVLKATNTEVIHVFCRAVECILAAMWINHSSGKPHNECFHSVISVFSSSPLCAANCEKTHTHTHSWCASATYILRAKCHQQSEWENMAHLLSGKVGHMTATPRWPMSYDPLAHTFIAVCSGKFEEARQSVTRPLVFIHQRAVVPLCSLGSLIDVTYHLPCRGLWVAPANGALHVSRLLNATKCTLQHYWDFFIHQISLNEDAVRCGTSEQHKNQ